MMNSIYFYKILTPKHIIIWLLVMLKNVLKLLKQNMQKSIFSISERYSHTYTYLFKCMSISPIYIIVNINKLISITLETHFI